MCVAYDKAEVHQPRCVGRREKELTGKRVHMPLLFCVGDRGHRTSDALERPVSARVPPGPPAGQPGSLARAGPGRPPGPPGPICQVAGMSIFVVDFVTG